MLLQFCRFSILSSESLKLFSERKTTLCRTDKKVSSFLSPLIIVQTDGINISTKVVVPHQAWNWAGFGLLHAQCLEEYFVWN
jgi:hypothetical protein